MIARSALWLLCLLCAGGVASAAPPMADQRGVASSNLAFTGFVVDQAGILTVAERVRLTDMLDRFQQRTGHQMAIVSVASLNGEAIKPFTMRLANRWGVGRAGINDGIVILVAPNQRQVRIEIGSGLERALPNAFCSVVMERRMIPAFRAGDFGRGLAAGAGAIIARFGSANAAARTR